MGSSGRFEMGFKCTFLFSARFFALAAVASSMWDVTSSMWAVKVALWALAASMRAVTGAE